MTALASQRNKGGAWLMSPRGNLRVCPICSGNLHRDRGEPYSCLWCGREWEVRRGLLEMLQPDPGVNRVRSDRAGEGESGHREDHVRYMSLEKWMPLLQRMAEKITERLRSGE